LPSLTLFFTAMLVLLKDFSLLALIFTGVFINGLLVVVSMSIYVGFTKILAHHKFQSKPQPILTKDILLGLVVLCCNAFVFVIAALLWQKNYIIVVPNQQWHVVIAELFLLVLSMDFLMYWLHRAMHSSPFFQYIHSSHHQHERTNALSLFVLHPLEAIAFGLLLMLLIYVYSFTALSIGIYLVLNLVWGTIGHLHVAFPPKRVTKIRIINQLGTSTFHYLHHQIPAYNFGFYTVIWDKIFKTAKENL
jgi:lathosterol oxidase